MVASYQQIVLILSKIITDLDIIKVIDDNNFDFRIVVQKVGYIYQKVGQNLGLRFGWFSLGPYSKSLQNLYSAIATTIEGIRRRDIDPSKELDNDTQMAIKNVIEFLEEFRSFVGTLDPKSLEVLASLIMVCSDIYPKPGDPVEELLKKKKNLSREFVKNIWRFLVDKNICG
ncbi:MAG: hypothetical protein QXW05_02555 [Ignisphaera sp.]